MNESDSAEVRQAGDVLVSKEVIEESHMKNDSTNTVQGNGEKVNEKKVRKKRDKNELFDDFFSLGDFESKKKKKKKKKDKIISSPVEPSSVASVEVESKSQSVELKDNAIEITDEKGPQNAEIYDREGRSDNKDLGNRIRSITPPPSFDREALKAQQTTGLRRSRRKQKEINLEESEDDDENLELLLNLLASNKSESEAYSTADDIDSYKFSFDNEKKRSYIIDVKSKLVDGSDSSAVFGTKGTKQFSKIISSIVSHFKIINKSIPSVSKRYDPSKVSLIWIEGKMEIKPFYKPSTLRVQPENYTPGTNVARLAPTILRCLLIPKENSHNFLELYPEFQDGFASFKKIAELTDEIEQISQREEKVVPSSDEDSDTSHIKTTETAAGSKSPMEVVDLEGESYFTIGLKGKDNKRIEVQVSPETKISALLAYYLKKKAILESEVNRDTVKLIFDDECLDLNATVGDTELEDDFEVQIVI